MIILSIYLTIAALSILVIFGYLLPEMRDKWDWIALPIAAIICGFLWPAVLAGALFDLADRK